MSKDYLESLERLAMPDELHVEECRKLGIGLTEDYDVVEQALLELKSIKEGKPSKTLKCLQVVENNIDYLISNIVIEEDEEDEVSDCLMIIKDQLPTIKQYILKTQNPKSYLKWEDLEPFEEDKEIFGLLNGNKYTLHTYRDSKHKYVLISLNGINMSTLCDMFKQDIDFFNDLHLERVLE